MMRMLQPRCPSRRLNRIILLVALALSLTRPGAVTAGFGGCRADPIVALSNGRVIQLTLTLATEPGHIHAILYTIHAPVGTSVTNIALTGGALKSKEVVAYVADLPPDQYRTDTLVTTAVEGIAVKNHARIGRHSGSTAGLSGEHLSVVFNLADQRD